MEQAHATRGLTDVLLMGREFKLEELTTIEQTDSSPQLEAGIAGIITTSSLMFPCVQCFCVSVRYSTGNVLFTGTSAETAGSVAVEANQEPKPFLGRDLLLGREQGL